MSDYYPYKIVQFPDDETKDASVDIACEKWIFHSDTHESMVCRFPCPPFSKADLTKLLEMVRCDQPADQSWPIHRVMVIGRAKTYKEALKAVKKVECEPYAFSTDRESSIERRIDEENHIRTAGDGKKKNIDDEFDDSIFQLMNERPSREKKRQPRKLLHKTPLNSRSQSPLSDRSTTEDLEKDREELSNESNGADDFSPVDVDADVLEKSLGDMDLEESTLSQKSNLSHHVPVNKSNEKSSTQSTSQSKKFSSSFDRSAPNIRGEKLSTLSADHDSLVTPTLKKTWTPRTENSSSEDHSKSLSDDGRCNDKTFRSQERDNRLTPSRRVNPPEQSLESPPNQRTIKRKRRSFSAEGSRQDKREVNPRHSRSFERENTGLIPKDSNKSPTRDGEPGSVFEVLNGIHAYMKEVHNSLSSRIDRLRGGQLETNGHIHELRNAMEKNPQQQAFDLDDDDLSYGVITLPVQSKADFYVFDAALKDKEYLKRVANKIKRMIDKEGIKTHSLGSIMRVFLSKTVVHEQFTALKGSGTKDALVNTNFYRVLKVVHQRVLKDKIDDKTFNNALKGVFNSAGDWDGGRLARTRPS